MVSILYTIFQLRLNLGRSQMEGHVPNTELLKIAQERIASLESELKAESNGRMERLNMIESRLRDLADFRSDVVVARLLEPRSSILSTEKLVAANVGLVDTPGLTTKASVDNTKISYNKVRTEEAARLSSSQILNERDRKQEQKRREAEERTAKERMKAAELERERERAVELARGPVNNTDGIDLLKRLRTLHVPSPPRIEVTKWDAFQKIPYGGGIKVRF